MILLLDIVIIKEKSLGIEKSRNRVTEHRAKFIQPDNIIPPSFSLFFIQQGSAIYKNSPVLTPQVSIPFFVIDHFTLFIQEKILTNKYFLL
jgi:hypothetical protein